MDEDLRVLHITEASSAGVLHAAGGLARRQAERGAQVTFAYIRRRDSPPTAEIDALLGRAVGVEFGNADDGMLPRVRALRAFAADAAASGGFDVMHAHSSLAGAALRIGARLPGFGGVVAYSPHGFAFLRRDVPAPVALGFRIAERVGARRGVLVAASDSERDLARRVLRPRDVAVVSNGIEELPPRATVDGPGRATVGIVGRIAYQKAPWRFAEVARSFADDAHFVWIGDGAAADVERWIGDAPVEVTGWLSPEDVRERVAGLSVFCFPTLWEGMPLALLEAQASGVPAVASRIVGNQDVVIDGETGFLVDDDSAMLSAVGRLLADGPLRARLGARAAATVAERYDAGRLAADSLALYRDRLARV